MNRLAVYCGSASPADPAYLQLARDEVEHGDEVLLGAIAARFAFGGLEDAVEPFHKGVGQAPLPMGQNPKQMVLDHLRHFKHGAKDPGFGEPSHPAHPAAPDL